MRVTELLLALASLGRTLLVCSTVALLGACTPGAGCSCGPDLPGEFEECTEDLRCAEGLRCFAGGGECEEDPPPAAVHVLRACLWHGRRLRWRGGKLHRQLR